MRRPPPLVTIRHGGEDMPAVLQATKTGMLFVLHRDTGEPLFPVEERAVPASDVTRERASSDAAVQLDPVEPARPRAEGPRSPRRSRSNGLRERDQGPAERRHLHAALRARHARATLQHRRRALGRPRLRRRPPDRRRAGQHDRLDGPADAGELRRARGRGGVRSSRPRLRVHAYGRHRLRDAASLPARPVGRFLLAAALGRAGRCRPREWQEILGSSAWQLSEGRCARLAESRRADHDGWQARVHRRDRGEGVSRFRRRDRRASLARRAARWRARDADHLSRRRPAVRRDCGRWRRLVWRSATTWSRSPCPDPTSAPEAC